MDKYLCYPFYFAITWSIYCHIIPKCFFFLIITSLTPYATTITLSALWMLTSITYITLIFISSITVPLFFFFYWYHFSKSLDFFLWSHFWDSPSNLTKRAQQHCFVNHSTPGITAKCLGIPFLCQLSHKILSEITSRQTRMKWHHGGGKPHMESDCFVCFIFIYFFFDHEPTRHSLNQYYCQPSNISCTKSQNLDIPGLVLQLSLADPLKPCVKLRMKM